MTLPWQELKLEVYSEQHMEILSQRGIDCSAADLKDLPTTTSTLCLAGLSEDDTERWVRRLQTCVPKRVTFDMKYVLFDSYRSNTYERHCYRLRILFRVLITGIVKLMVKLENTRTPTLEHRYSAATMLTDKSKMKELADGDTKPRLPKLVKQAAGYLLDNAHYDIDRIHSYTSLLLNVRGLLFHFLQECTSYHLYALICVTRK